MKKTLILLLITIIAFVFFTACGNSNDDTLAGAITDAASNVASEVNPVINDDSSVNDNSVNDMPSSEISQSTDAVEFDIKAFGDIEINGEYFVPTSSEPNLMHLLYDVRYIYYNEIIVAAYEFEDESAYQGAVEFFNPSNGQSIYWQEFEYPIVLDSVRYDKNTDSVSLWTNDRFMYYFEFDGISIHKEVFELPNYLKNVDTSNPFYSYDGVPFAKETAWWGATFEDGLALIPHEGNPSEQIFIPSTWLMDNVGFSEDTPEEFRVAVFDNVQIIDEGRVVVCAIAVPGSQTAHVGLYTLNTQTLEEQFYFDIFEGMFADYRIIDDNTIMVTGYDSCTKINIKEGTTETLSIPEENNRATYNFEEFFIASFSDSGKIIHTGDVNVPIATTSNERTFIHQAIENYLVLINYSDDYGIKTVLIKV